MMPFVPDKDPIALRPTVLCRTQSLLALAALPGGEWAGAHPEAVVGRWTLLALLVPIAPTALGQLAEQVLPLDMLALLSATPAELAELRRSEEGQQAQKKRELDFARNPS
jgi:hypothetical protein